MRALYAKAVGMTNFLLILLRLSDFGNKLCRLKDFQTAWTIQIDVVYIKQGGRQQRRKLFFTSERCSEFNDARNRRGFRVRLPPPVRRHGNLNVPSRRWRHW